MKNEEYDNFVDLMEKLHQNFKGEIDIPKIKMYFSQLKKYKLFAVNRGINYIIDTRIYPDFPIVGQIVKAIKDSKHRGQI